MEENEADKIADRERLARAEKAAADAQYRVEKQRERAAKAERRAMRSNRREVLPMKAKLIMGGSLCGGGRCGGCLWHSRLSSEPK